MLPFEHGHDGHYGCDITDALTRFVPKLPLRQSPPGRMAHSAALLIDSTRSARQIP